MAHSHDHSHEHDTFGLVSIVLSAPVLLAAVFSAEGTTQLALCILAYIAAGWRVLKAAGENILQGEIFDENFLMTGASLGAFCIGEYPEAAAVMVLFQIGEWLQERAVERSRRSVKALIGLRADRATLLNGKEAPAESIAIGELIRIRPGERIPLDGIIREGSASVDTAALTGESVPVHWQAGDAALAGCMNLDGILTVEVTKPLAESSISRIMALVEEAEQNKATQERFITRFARSYTPIVCALAVLIATLPLFGIGTWQQYLHKALSFLVISCPCALVISVPLGFFAGIGCASHHGILIKGSHYLELLAKASTAAFDKTGTLTRGCFTVAEVHAVDISADALSEIAAYAEFQSSHPLALAVRNAYHGEIDASRLQDFREISGLGIRATLDDKPLLAGKSTLLQRDGIISESTDTAAIHISWDGKYLGYLQFSDSPKPDSPEAIRQLHALGLRDLTMLSGDRTAVAESVGRTLGLDHVFGELMPEDKVAGMRKLQQQGIALYAGDGINDAPVLVTADVGIAMGALGCEAATESADVVIMSDELIRIPLSIRISRKTMRIVRENIALSVAVKLLILLVSFFLNFELWLAVFADVGVAMLAILNSLRALRIR